MTRSCFFIVLICVSITYSAPPNTKSHGQDGAKHDVDQTKDNIPDIKGTKPHQTKDETSERAKSSKRADNPFTFEDIFNSSLKYRSVSVRWVTGEDVYIYRENGDLLSYDVVNNVTELLVPSSVFTDLGASRYYVSPDNRYVLLAYDVTSIWRYSFLARYKVYDRQEQNPDNQLVDFPNYTGLENEQLQFADWSPLGSLAFVSGNNLFYQPDPYSPAVRVTSSGDNKYIFNGHADWLYEEEILGSNVANWWSANGQYLCYAVFNDTKVPLYKYPYYGPKTDMYGDIVEVAYPKAGDVTPDANSKASLYIMPISDVLGQHVQLQPPANLANTEYYFTQVSWRDGSYVSVVWANRAQNYTVTSICDVTTGTCQTNREYSVSGGWSDPGDYLDFVENGQAYITIAPREVLSQGSWNHVAYVTAPVDTTGSVTFLTDGAVEIKSLAGFEADRNLVYYISTSGDPRKRHLYRVGTPSADPEYQTPQCLTCDLAPGCDYVSASFSSTGRYYVLSCRGPEIPSYYLRDTQGVVDVLLENNEDIKANLQQKDLPKKEFLQIPVGGGYSAWAEVNIPPSIDTGSGPFPLLVNTYSGPGSQGVDLRFGTGFDTYISSSENVVVARIDGRGTASRGNDFRFLMYRKLGVVEIEDTILGGSYLTNFLEYVDASKTAAWGWSYGGFATNHLVANETNVYMCGISGASLSSMRYYDTAYTERFMGRSTPEDNSAGYDATDVINKIELFRNKKLLVVHGTADDNVHFLSSTQLVKALVDADIQFRLMVYPDKNHYFSNSNRHLLSLYSDFLVNDCFGPNN